MVASSCLGTVSGSAVANVVTTGPFTIPLMKQIGYRPRFAGAVEACASSGGQITPPIMGAAAFLVAEFLHISYLWVIVAAIIPTVLYFTTVYFMVHLEAEKHGSVASIATSCRSSEKSSRGDGTCCWPSVSSLASCSPATRQCLRRSGRSSR